MKIVNFLMQFRLFFVVSFFCFLEEIKLGFVTFFDLEKKIMSRSLKIEDKTGENEPLETPAFVVPTEYGLIPCLTPDLAEDFPLYFYAGDFINTTLPKSMKASTALGLSKRWIFLGPSANFFNFDEGPSKKGVRLYQRNGSVVIIGPEEYAQLVDYIKPQCTVSLHSHILSHNTSSRQKNLRTENAKQNAEECLQNEHYKNTIIFTPISAENKETGLFVQFTEPFEETEELRKIISEQANDKPRMILFDGHPLDIWKAVHCGFDIFVPTFPIYCADHDIALTFEFDEEKIRNNEIGINLNSREFEHDHGPIVEGCKCICCRQNSRSYLHHLINVHELLGHVFLVQHNLYHYRRFFEYIRNQLNQ